MLPHRTLTGAANATYPQVKRFLGVSSVAIPGLGLPRGHDFCRCGTYQFLPQAILLGLAAQMASRYE